jgi:hypothetical protein
MTPVTVGVPPARAANEAAVITEAAIGLASQTIDPFTRALISGIGRGELTGDQAVKAIVSRWTPTSIRDQASVEARPCSTRSSAGAKCFKGQRATWASEDATESQT